MFGDFQSASGRYKGAGGGNIDTVAAVTTGTDNIGKQIIRSRERGGVFQQRGCRTGNFIRVLATNFHAHQRRSQLFRLQFTAYHGGEQLVAFLLRQRLGLIQFLQNRLQGIGLFEFLLRPGQRLLQQTCALGGQNGFWMELEATYAIGIVTYRHHHAVKVGVDGQSGRNVAANQRVIARHWQRICQTGEHCLTIVFNAGRFAVQDFPSLSHVSTIGLDNGLMPQTNADDWQLAAQAG